MFTLIEFTSGEWNPISIALTVLADFIMIAALYYSSKKNQKEGTHRTN
tara:strand:+ start:71 stop:214 length:144 start_codon:yes stop_codon:yes gene_type:complete